MATGTSPSAAPAARMDPHTARRGMFVIKDGRNVLFTFLLLIFLFALWGFCNGVIDVMDKHFQEELHLSLSQSAWVQFAHYLGYFLMALPAGKLARNPCRFASLRSPVECWQLAHMGAKARKPVLRDDGSFQRGVRRLLRAQQ